MNYFRKIILLVFTFAIVQNIDAQSISYYPFGNAQQLSISTNPTKVVWMDFRLQMNSFISSLNTEPALMVNLAYTRNANFYAGGGVNL